MYESAGLGPDASERKPPRKGSIVQRLSRYGMQVMPGASQRRSRLQRQHEVTEGDAPDRETVRPTLRKKYLKELLSSSSSVPAEEETDWALYPMEHAWMLLAVEGNYEAIMNFISEDPQLLSRRDFISGYSVLHWLAKRGEDEALLKLLRFAERADIRVDVNLRGSGGLTPLHVASIHGRFAVVKLLVGAFGASLDAMDYNGRRPWQYLREDAPLEMKELLGTWDEEHSCSFHANVNNNCAGAESAAACNEPDCAEPEEASSFEKSKRGSWRFGSLKKIKSSLFVRSKT